MENNMRGNTFYVLSILIFFLFFCDFSASASDSVDTNSQNVCIQVVVWAKDPQTGCWKMFPTPCDVPSGWEMNYNFIDNRRCEYIYGECGRFEPEDNILYLPLVKVGDDFYDVSLSFMHHMFGLREASKTHQKNYLYGTYNMTQQILDIPCVYAYNSTFNVTLRQIVDDPINFQIDQVKEIKITYLSKDHNSTNIVLKKGDILEISLDEAFDGGYRWEILDIDSSLLKVVGSYTKNPNIYVPTTIVGGDLIRVFGIQALSQGETVLKLIERRPWEDNWVSSYVLYISIQ